MPAMTDPAAKRCFIAVPITTHPDQAADYGDEQHWQHVMEHLFIPAIEKAGFVAVTPKSAGTSMIHDDIVKNLGNCEMVLCDYSGLNANVFFELGVRVSLDKPMTLVHDEKTRIPFDLGGASAESYDSDCLSPWALPPQIEKLAAHIQDAERTCAGRNPLWKQYGLGIRAQEASSTETPGGSRV